MTIGAMASIVPYVGIGELIRRVIEAKSVTLDNSLTIVAGVVIAEVIYAIFYMLGLIVSHHAAYGTLENIRKTLQEKMEKLPLGFVMNKGSGEIKKLFTDDVESIEALLAHMIPEGLANLCVPVIALVILVAIDWKLALLTMLMVFIGISVSRQMYTVGMNKMGSYFAAGKRMNNAIVEYVNGMEVVRVFNRQKDSDYKYEKAVNEYRDYALEWYRVSWPWMALYKSVFANIVLYSLPFGALFVLLGQMSISNYILALMISFGTGPMLLHCMSFIGAVPQVSYKIEALESAMDSVPLKTMEEEFAGSDNTVEFRDVHFSYKDAEVIKGVSFTAAEGETTALVGMSGSGKSTLAKLLVHYYEISGGEITIGGQDIRSMSLDALNERISFVSQSVFLFNKTIMENIRMGRPDASDEEVIAAARLAECDDFIMELRDGYQTMAGSAGGALSGGQRQRISFARAILKDAPIIVFDEATAYVDAENEKKMKRAISEITRDKTVIVIAHKLKSIENADRIVVIDNGRIVGCGKNDELLGNCEEYRRLWNLNEATQDWQLKKEAQI
ncbi:MAG: ABC transporter ATP-binding protein/permease [Lachnospiraceae bacterium]|nr:ABC transporter ATP-binding protein/permease [Lachnospiraceae bacterium]